jgi:hypothetical protein
VAGGRAVGGEPQQVRADLDLRGQFPFTTAASPSVWATVASSVALVLGGLNIVDVARAITAALWKAK